MSTSLPKILLGKVLQFVDDPFTVHPSKAAQIISDGAIVLQAEKIVAIGDKQSISRQYPTAPVIDYGNKLLSAGFIDAHAHYPQTGIINSWGKRLIDWLNSYTFPEESRFHDYAYAERMAELYHDLILSMGTTTACNYCTIHPESVEAYFQAASKRGMLMLGGKTCMDRNAPDALRDTAKLAYDQSKSLLEKWHGKGRNHYVITPRFSPTSSCDQLQALGDLWAEFPDCLMQTHLSEQGDEVEWVKSLFPKARDYLDTYESYGLLGKKALYGHAIWLEEREIARIKELDASLIHCPTSNAYLGSGIFAMEEYRSLDIRTGLATDTGGGSSFSMLRTMASTYELSQLKGTCLHPVQLWWLSTLGSSRALHLDDRIGNLREGMDADIVVVDLFSSPAITQRAKRAEEEWEEIFPTIMMGDDRAIHQVYVAGNPML